MAHKPNGGRMSRARILADTTAIVAEKQRLRDITNSVNSCTTTGELKSLSCL
jgi:hypothetical protein